jgi:hypothetical protein
MQRVNHVRERDQAFAGMADGGFGGGVWDHVYCVTRRVTNGLNRAPRNNVVVRTTAAPKHTPRLHAEQQRDAAIETRSGRGSRQK